MLKLEYAKPIAHAKYIIPLAGLMNGVLIGALLWMPMAGGHGGVRVFEVFKWGSLPPWRNPVLCAKMSILVLAAGTVIMTRRGSVILGCIGCTGVLVTWAMFMLRVGRRDVGISDVLDTSAILVATVIARLVLV